MRTSLVNFAIRRLVKPKLKACKTPLDVRKAFASAMPWPRDVRYASATMGGIAGEWAEPKDGSPVLGAMLYVHGGGFVSMSAQSVRAVTGGFAQRGVRVFTADYRLAPEHLFPASLNDLTQTWRAMREQIDGPIFLAGDSAGGGLAASLLLKLRDEGDAGPTATCLFSPWADLQLTGATLESNKDRDPMQAKSTLEMLAAAYAGTADLSSPYLSPINGSFFDISPIVAFAGDTEILLDDAKRLVERAQAQDASAELRIYPNMPHAWPLLSKLLPEGGQALDEARAFFQSSALRDLRKKGLGSRGPGSVGNVAKTA